MLDDLDDYHVTAIVGFLHGLVDQWLCDNYVGKDRAGRT